MSGPSRFDRTLNVILMVRATFDPENAGDDAARRAYLDARKAAAEDPEFAEWLRQNLGFVAIAAEADHRGLLAGTGNVATEADLRAAAERLREALYLMTSLTAHFVKLYAAAVRRRPIDVLDSLIGRLRSNAAADLDSSGPDPNAGPDLENADVGPEKR